MSGILVVYIIIGFIGFTGFIGFIGLIGFRVGALTPSYGCEFRAMLYFLAGSQYDLAEVCAFGRPALSPCSFAVIYFQTYSDHGCSIFQRLHQSKTLISLNWHPRPFNIDVWRL